jgi:hypothetical protein
MALRDLPEGVEIANILFSGSDVIMLFSSFKVVFIGCETSFDNAILRRLCVV